MFPYTDLIGVPFVDGGRDLSGLDCWGLARICFARQGIVLPDYAISAHDVLSVSRRAQEERGAWEELAGPEAGCLVAISTSERTWVNHVGVCISTGKFVHAYVCTGVCIARIRRWRAHIVGFYRYRGGGCA